jgi:hypothetical protein
MGDSGRERQRKGGDRKNDRKEKMIRPQGGYRLLTFHEPPPRFPSGNRSAAPLPKAYIGPVAPWAKRSSQLAIAKKSFGPGQRNRQRESWKSSGIKIFLRASSRLSDPLREPSASRIENIPAIQSMLLPAQPGLIHGLTLSGWLLMIKKENWVSTFLETPPGLPCLDRLGPSPE